MATTIYFSMQAPAATIQGQHLFEGSANKLHGTFSFCLHLLIQCLSTLKYLPLLYWCFILPLLYWCFILPL